MACPAIITGDVFVTRVLTHIDCQARYLGSYGYQSLSEPGSIAAVLVTGLLTLFVAFWGFRLLLGPRPNGRDAVIDVLKIGIVLTLAFSWPAFRTVIHDVVLDGPAEIASSISTPGLQGTGSGFVERLQAADNAIVGLTETSTGRRSGQFIDGQAVGGTFSGSALEDEAALGWARLSFLTGIFGSLALLRIATGLLLAIAPLAAGLLLFEATRGLFGGWLRSLVFALMAATAVTFTLAIELAMLEPWLADALRVRQQGYATPSAPIELLAMTLAFTVVHFAIIWLLARLCFHESWSARMVRIILPEQGDAVQKHSTDTATNVRSPSRAERLSDQIETRIRIEERGEPARISHGSSNAAGQRDASNQDDMRTNQRPRLGSSYRRAIRNASISSGRRDAAT